MGSTKEIQIGSLAYCLYIITAVDAPPATGLDGLNCSVCTALTVYELGAFPTHLGNPNSDATTSSVRLIHMQYPVG